MVEKRDMALLIEVEDELHNMDQVLEQLAEHGHASGEFIKLDNVFDVIQTIPMSVFPVNRMKQCRRFLILCRTGTGHQRNGQRF
ncbi:MAG: hypothetical protein HFH62_11065 [Lachnospiraceae bacterium]|nr:hypothetical protein [Lachnospiraceae bacterium]